MDYIINYLYTHECVLQGSAFICEGRDEKEEFSRLNKAFSTLNFTDKEISSIFQLLAALLHIGNFTYVSKDGKIYFSIISIY